MLFCQVWIARRATIPNLVKPQTFPLENSRGSNSGLRFSLVFWMSLYKDYPECNTTISQDNKMVKFLSIVYYIHKNSVQLISALCRPSSGTKLKILKNNFHLHWRHKSFHAAMLYCLSNPKTCVQVESLEPRFAA